MITAENITDAQIRELRSEFDPSDPIATLCNYALGMYASVHAARARCAEILEARRKEGR